MDTIHLTTWREAPIKVFDGSGIRCVCLDEDGLTGAHGAPVISGSPVKGLEPGLKQLPAS